MVRRLVAVALGLALVTGVARAHPLHVTYADVARNGAAVTVTLRVYTDDLLKVSGGARGVEAYVRAHFTLQDGTGRVLVLASCGTAVHGDMTHVCLRGAASASAMRLSNDLLVGLYADQINVVRSVRGTVLFTKSRPVQRLST